MQTLSTKFAKPAGRTALEKTAKALRANGFNVTIVDNLTQVKRTVELLIPRNSEVFTATSRTLEETGLNQALNESPRYVSVRHKFIALADQPDRAVEIRRIGSGSDYAVGSVHAITEDGQAVIASASGSQLPNYVYGATHVIWVVGSQKIVKDLNEGIRRIEDYTFHLEDERAQAAYGAHSSINKLLIYRKEPNERVTIILIKEAVGF